MEKMPLCRLCLGHNTGKSVGIQGPTRTRPVQKPVPARTGMGFLQVGYGFLPGIAVCARVAGVGAGVHTNSWIYLVRALLNVN